MDLPTFLKKLMVEILFKLVYIKGDFKPLVS